MQQEPADVYSCDHFDDEGMAAGTHEGGWGRFVRGWLFLIADCTVEMHVKHIRPSNDEEKNAAGTCLGVRGVEAVQLTSAVGVAV